MREVSTTHESQTSHCHHTAHCVGDGHQWRVERRRYTPHNLVTKERINERKGEERGVGLLKIEERERDLDNNTQRRQTIRKW